MCSPKPAKGVSIFLKKATINQKVKDVMLSYIVSHCTILYFPTLYVLLNCTILVLKFLLLTASKAERQTRLGPFKGAGLRVAGFRVWHEIRGSNTGVIRRPQKTVTLGIHFPIGKQPVGLSRSTPCRMWNACWHEFCKVGCASLACLSFSDSALTAQPASQRPRRAIEKIRQAPEWAPSLNR